MAEENKPNWLPLTIEQRAIFSTYIQSPGTGTDVILVGCTWMGQPAAVVCDYIEDDDGGVQIHPVLLILDENLLQRFGDQLMGPENQPLGELAAKMGWVDFGGARNVAVSQQTELTVKVVDPSPTERCSCGISDLYDCPVHVGR